MKRSKGASLVSREPKASASSALAFGSRLNAEEVRTTVHGIKPP
jgi:hypothetical protein